MPKRNLFRYFAHNLTIVISLVLVWRGIWHLLDGFDIIFMGNNHFFSSILGIIIGITLLYLPDGDLKEIEKL